MRTPKPLISYYGGKQRIASKIVPHLEQIPHTVYATPFAGGLGVLYAKPFPYWIGDGSHYREAINDTSGLLVNLYRVARNQPEEFARMIELTPYARDEHSRAKQICKDPDIYSDLEKAWAYYTNIQMSFANILNAGWGVALKSQNLAATWRNKTDRLPQALQRIRQIHIDNQDALDFIRQWDSPQTLFYCDPPYVNTDLGHYDGYTVENYQALCDLLDSIEGSYVLSNYGQDVEPRSADRRVEITATMSASGKGKVGRQGQKGQVATQDELGDRERTEVLWICDRSKGISRSLDPALNALKTEQKSLFN